MKKLTILFAVLFASIMSWGADVTITNGSNASGCTVNGVTGVKLGTSKASGDCSITVPAGSTKLTLYAAAWKGVTGLSLEISGATTNPSSLSLTADDGVSNNSPFTLSGNAESFKFEIALANITAATTLDFSASKRCVIWGVSAEVSSPSDVVLTPTITPNGGNFETSQEVAITCATTGATITYTTNNWATSNTYTAPFTITETTTVKAKATKAGMDDSSEASATFTKRELINCATASALAKDEVAYLNEVTVVYVVADKGYIYVKDASGYALIYDYDYDDVLVAGDKVSGIVATSSPYNGLPELKPTVSASDLTITKGTAPAAIEFTTVPVAADVNKYIVLKNVEFGTTATFTTSSATNATGTIGGNTFTLRNNFKFAKTLTKGVKYNIYGTVAIYNETVQVYFISEEEVPDTQYSITISPSTNGAISTNVTEAAEGVEVTITATPADHYELSSITVIGDESGDPVTVTNSKFTMPAESVTITASFAEKAKYAVKFYSLGVQIGDTRNVYDGDVAGAAPIATNTPDGWTFAGWINNASFETGTTAPAFADPTAMVITEATNFYAVFSKAEGGVAEAWNKVTADLTDWTGEYLLVYEASETEGLLWTGIDAGQCHVDAMIISGSISEKPDGAVSLTIATMTGGYSIMVNGGENDGKYIGGTSGSNALNFSSSPTLNTISYDTAAVISSNTSMMRYNKSSGSSNERFRYYKTASYATQQPVQLYKHTGGAATTYTITTPPTASVTVTYKGVAIENNSQFELAKVGIGEGTSNGFRHLVVTATGVALEDLAWAITESTIGSFNPFTINPVTATAFYNDGVENSIRIDYSVTDASAGPIYAGDLTIFEKEETSNVYFTCTLKLGTDNSMAVGTAVDNINGSVDVQKIVRNGQVLIIRDGKMYNMLGAVVE